MLSGIPARGRTVAALEQALLEQVETLRRDPVEEKELARIRAQLVADRVFEQDSVYYQALQIGALETQGYDWRLIDDYVENIRAVTADQVRRVARKYLVEDQLTVAWLEPQPIAAAGDAE
jgi:zinc protease